MSESTKPQTVGYKRPPTNSQFKPGKSGNPRGRPKHKVNLSQSMNRVLDDKVVLTGPGNAKTGLEVFVQSVVNRVLQGDAKAIPALMKLLTKTDQFKPIPLPSQMTGVVVMSLADLEKFRRGNGRRSSIFGEPLKPGRSDQ